jgi:PAS domain S-box-containing protein
MSNDWLAFGLTAQQEDRYRKSSLGAYLAQARICLLLTLVPAAGFAVNDYMFYGLSWPFYGIAALRLAFLVGTLALVRWMRKATRYESYDNAEFIWGAFLVVLLLFMAATRPQGFIVHAILAVVMVFVTLLAIPNRFAHQLALSLAILAGETLVLARSFSAMPQAAVSVIFSMFLAGAIGVAVAHQLHRYRRGEFLATEREQDARAAAETELADRKRAEEVVQESDRRYHSLFTGMTEGFAIHEIITDASGTPIDYRFLDINPAFERLTGHKRQNVIGRTVKEIMPGTDAHWIQSYGQVALTGQAARFENYSTPLGKHYEVFAYQPAPRQFAVLFTDISERKEAQGAMQTTLLRFYAILSSMYPDILLVTDQGRVEFANQAFCDSLGLDDKPADLIGLDAAAMIQKIKNAYLHADQAVARIGQIVQRGQPVKGEEIAMRDGRTCLRDFVPVKVNGQSYGRMWFHYDITHRKRAEDALQATVWDLERSNRELEQFAYIASHDLQEPLRQVRAFVGLLKDRHGDKFEGQAQQYFKFVYEGAVRMSDLVQGLLAYSRAGDKDARKRPVPCQKAMDTALANLQAGIAESRARVTHDELPTVLAEPTQLSQLFQNLIGNAVKFRRDGLAPLIHVACQRDDGHWLFRVTDNGIGIAPEFHEKVFMIFQRLHGRGKYPGTGIGLAICKKIVEQHGGKIWIESQPDEGSTFCFTLPEDRGA